MAIHSPRSRALIRESLESLSDFKLNRTVEGKSSTLLMSTGQLPSELRELLYKHRDATDSLYVVYSYATPIAWHTPETGWIVPSRKYSVTTTNHQSAVRSALHYDCTEV